MPSIGESSWCFLNSMRHLPANADEALREAISKGNIVFVAGTGVSMASTYDPATKSSHPQASWTRLLRHGLETGERMGRLEKSKAALYLTLLKEDPTTQNLISAATTVTNALGGVQSGIFKDWLESTIGKIRPLNRDIIDALHALRVAGNLLATTNYDDVLLDYCSALRPVTWMDGNEFIGAQRNRELDKVIYLHGYWKRPDTVILDGRSYEQISRHEQYREDLAAFWRTTTWIYVGCGVNGLGDPDFGLLLERHGERARDANHWDFCLVLKSDQGPFQKRFDDLKLNIVAVSYGDKLGALPGYLRSLLPAPSPASVPSGVAASVPSDPDSTAIPTAPAFYAEPDYIGSHQFVGRQAELDALSDWANRSDPTNLLLFEAIGGNGKSMLTWEWTIWHATKGVEHRPRRRSRARPRPARPHPAAQSHTFRRHRRPARCQPPTPLHPRPLVRVRGLRGTQSLQSPPVTGASRSAEADASRAHSALGASVGSREMPNADPLQSSTRRVGRIRAVSERLGSLGGV